MQAGLQWQLTEARHGELAASLDAEAARQEAEKQLGELVKALNEGMKALKVSRGAGTPQGHEQAAADVVERITQSNA